MKTKAGAWHLVPMLNNLGIVNKNDTMELKGNLLELSELQNNEALYEVSGYILEFVYIGIVSMDELMDKK